MSLQSVLFDIDELHSFSDLSTFAQHIPVEWVASALDLSSSATIRRRRLPSDQVLWLVLGMALFRNEPISEVARRLNICAQGLASDSLLARSGVSQARQRLGAELQWLFRQTGECWGKERYPGDDWHGLPVLAADGAVLRTPDTPALREHFGSGNTSTDRQTPFPMMRLVALMNVRSHVMLDAQPSPYRRSEIRLADEFRDIKSSLQHNAVTLRSKTVALIYQEVWGLLLGYNVIRREASQAAVAHGQEPPECASSSPINTSPPSSLSWLRRNLCHAPERDWLNSGPESATCCWIDDLGLPGRGPSRYPRLATP